MLELFQMVSRHIQKGEPSTMRCVLNFELNFIDCNHDLSLRDSNRTRTRTILHEYVSHCMCCWHILYARRGLYSVRKHRILSTVCRGEAYQ